MTKKIVIPKAARKKLKKLPSRIQDKFWFSLKKVIENPSYPSLRHGKIEGTEHWEFSLTMNYRVTYKLEVDKLIILNVGKHEDVF